MLAAAEPRYCRGIGRIADELETAHALDSENAARTELLPSGAECRLTERAG